MPAAEIAVHLMLLLACVKPITPEPFAAEPLVVVGEVRGPEVSIFLLPSPAEVAPPEGTDPARVAAWSGWREARRPPAEGEDRAAREAAQVATAAAVRELLVGAPPPLPAWERWALAEVLAWEERRRWLDATIAWEASAEADPEAAGEPPRASYAAPLDLLRSMLAAGPGGPGADAAHHAAAGLLLDELSVHPWQEGTRAEAATHLERLVAEHPTSPLAPEAHLRLGQLRLEDGDALAARPHLEAALAAEPMIAGYLLAYACERAGDLGCALARYDALAADPAAEDYGPEARARMALSLHELAVGSAWASERARLGVAPDAPVVAVAEAWMGARGPQAHDRDVLLALAAGLFDRAERAALAERLLARWPEDPEAAAWAGRIEPVAAPSVAQVLRQNAGGLRRCGGAGGRLEVAWIVVGGRATDVQVTADTTGDPAVGACVRDEIARWTLDAPDGQRVTLPIELRVE